MLPISRTLLRLRGAGAAPFLRRLPPCSSRGAAMATLPAGPCPSDDHARLDDFIKAAFFGDLHSLKGIVKDLSDPAAAVRSVHKDGFNVLSCAACAGHLEVCKYLVEELGADVNAPVAGGVTPFMAAAQTDDVCTVEYLLEHGGDLMKADDKGGTVFHHAVAAGSCNITKFLLSKGVPVDIDCGCGTPLYFAATNEREKVVKILLDHHANPNTFVCDGCGTPLMSALIYRSMKCMELLLKAGADINGKSHLIPPLVFATMMGGYTNFVQFLLKAGADPNIPDDLGRLPVEFAALRGCTEEIEMLFPLTSPIPDVPNWSIDGIITHAKLKEAKPVSPQDIQRRKASMKSQAEWFFRIKDYKQASRAYGLAIGLGPDAELYSNRSLCRLLMGDGEGALSDAIVCRTMRPNWAKACYRQGAVHMLLKEYKQACEALLDAQKLDPVNVEIESELRKARELMRKTS